MKKERYFYVTYLCRIDDGGVAHGSMNIHGRKFPSIKEMVDHLKKDVVITFIYEFKSKEDYEAFKAE